MALHLLFPRLLCSSTHPFIWGLRTSSNPRTHARAERRFTTAAQEPQRRGAVYSPSSWEFHYIQSLKSDHTDEAHARRSIEVLEEVRRLISKEKELVDQLELVDTLRQLGVSYHFEKEIKDVVGSMPVSVENIRMVLKDDLHSTALLFRLLRDHGTFVSQDVFDNFKDETGDFRACLCEDTKGMLSLYEASYLSVKGDDKLDEARAFTTKHLKGLVESSLEPSLRKHVAHALKLPMNWRAPRVHMRWFIDFYEMDENMDPILLEFAKLDFNMVQGIHRRELKELSRWWTNLGLGEKLGFARDRLIESFLLTIGTAFEPKFQKTREGGTKFIALITLIDDIYDVYGSMDELKLFTDVVKRWDVDSLEQLPEYMKICYLALFNSTNELAYDVLRERGLDIIPYLKKGWANLCNSYLVEAKWHHSGYTPTLKEYMDNAWISIGVQMVLIYGYFTVSQDITSEALEGLISNSSIIYHSSKSFRLSNDFGTSTIEVNRGDVPKSIQCQMHECGVSEAVARENIQALISDTWKELNGDRFGMPIFEEPFNWFAINSARIGQCVYHHGDEFGNPDQEAKDQVISLLIEPISMEMDSQGLACLGYGYCPSSI